MGHKPYYHLYLFPFVVPPTTVQIKIADINAPQEYNVKMANQKDVAVECIAEEARPPPKFTWFLGEDQLNVSPILEIKLYSNDITLFII